VPARRKAVLAISGSTRERSSNLCILERLAEWSAGRFDMQIYQRLAELPHFNPDLDAGDPPATVAELRQMVEAADGVIICTPEYVFNLPGTLKNALDWMVSTTIFSDKPAALIVASGLGEKAFESLQLIMKTVGANVAADATLLIKGARTKVDESGEITDAETVAQLRSLLDALDAAMELNMQKEATG
jgi:NAD(P)H-dependent FMN reductase